MTSELLRNIERWEATVEKAHAANEALREATREAHSTIKALRQAEKDAKVAADYVAKVLVEKSEDLIGEKVRTGLEMFKADLDEAMRRGEAAVLKRFDTIANELLYDGGRQPKGLTVFEEIAKRNIRQGGS